MTGPITHIIGAGMSGLSAAVSLVKTGHWVVVHESAGYAGGRCRSFQDDAKGVASTTATTCCSAAIGRF